MDFLTGLFDTSGFPARWQCGAGWAAIPWLAWLHILSDLGVWSAYLAIPFVLVYFLVRRKDLPFRKLFLLFGAFILACGATHLMEAIIFWWPAYRLAAVIKLLTAIISWATVIALFRVVPIVLTMRTPEALQREIDARKLAEQDLQESEQRFRQLADSMPQIIWSARSDGCLDYYNRKWYALTGADESATGDQSWLPILHPDDRQKCLDIWYASVQTGEPYQIEYRFRFPETNDYRWHLGRALPVRDEQDRIVRWYGTCTDIHDQKQCQDQLRELNATLEQRVVDRSNALREHEERFRSAFDHAPIGMALVAPSGKWLLVNHAICKIVGYTESELLAIDFQTITNPDDLEIDLGNVRKMLAGELKTYQMEKRYIHKKGHVVNILLSVSLLRDGEGHPLYFISQIEDITRRKEAEERIKASLREKEVLLREIHHRVKNNLQIVSTLLDLQSDHTQDPQVLKMFKESRGRVKSMALIHERLYHSQDFAHVNFVEYIRRLADDLLHVYKMSNIEIVLEMDVQVLSLPIDVAVPCGLLLNELMSNCLKHAFKASSAAGCIRVTLRSRDNDSIVLAVADDGIGFPHDLDYRNTTSFGMQLVNTLIKQLHGELEMKNHRGTEFAVTFSTSDSRPKE